MDADPVKIPLNSVRTLLKLDTINLTILFLIHNCNLLSRE